MPRKLKYFKINFRKAVRTLLLWETVSLWHSVVNTPTFAFQVTHNINTLAYFPDKRAVMSIHGTEAEVHHTHGKLPLAFCIE